MPLMFAIAEFLGIRKNDLQYIAMAKRWAKAYTITVAVGVVTGTIIGLQLSLIWPTFMEMVDTLLHFHYLWKHLRSSLKLFS